MTKKVKPLAGTRRQKPAINKKKIYYFSSFLILFIVALYWKSIGFGIVWLDDNIFCVDNIKYYSHFSNITKVFGTTVIQLFYRPVLDISFIIDGVLSHGGKNLSEYHSMNIVYHAVATFLLLFVFRKLKYPDLIAFSVAIVFAVHPLLTAAVTWIPGRNDSLLAIFIFTAFLFYMRFEETKDARKWLWYFAHLIFFLISLFTKEVAIVLPIVAVAYSGLFVGRKILTKNYAIAALGWIVVVLPWLLMRQHALQPILNLNTNLITGGAIIQNLAVLPSVISKIFIPVNLSLLSSFNTFATISGLILIAAIIAFTIFNKKINTKLVLFAGLWFLIFLIPTMVVRLPFNDDLFDYSEHRAYLPFLGLLIIIAEIILATNILKRKKGFIGVAAIVIISLSVATFQYQDVFQNRFSFWGNCTMVNPEKARPWGDLGLAYALADSLPKAEEMFLTGEKLNPRHPILYLNMSNLYLMKRDFDKAGYYAKKALAIDSIEPKANANLASAYSAMHQYDKAIPYLERAVAYTYDYPQMFVDLGFAYLQTRQYDRAVQVYLKSIELDPRNFVAYSDIGVTYYYMQKYPAAEREWLQALRINPAAQQVYVNLINLYTSVLKNPGQARYYAVQYKNHGWNLTPQMEALLH